MIRPLTSPAPAARTLDPRVFTAAVTLAEDCEYEAGHAHHVARLAARLFDELADHHQLAPIDRQYLHLAAILHDIGHVGGRKKHHKRTLALILEADDLYLGGVDRLIVGSVARYHRKALPHLRHDHYAQLNPDDRARVRMLAGLLRVADGLDNGHQSIVRDLRCTLSPARILIDCTVRHLYEAQRLIEPLRKAELLEQELHRPADLYIRSAE